MKSPLNTYSEAPITITGTDIVIEGSRYARACWYSDGRVRYYRKNKRWIEAQPYLKGEPFEVTPSIDGNKITFAGGKYVWVEYEYLDDKLKETIVFDDAPQSKRIHIEDVSFHLSCSEGTEIHQELDGTIALYRSATESGITERVLITIPVPVAYDALDIEYPLAWSYDTETSMLTISGDLSTAIYPIIIDPTVQIDNSVDAPCQYCHKQLAMDSSGRMWAAWEDDGDVETGYADTVGGSWTTQEPHYGGAKDALYACTIAIDSSRNVHLLISWMEDGEASPYKISYYKWTHSASSWSSITDLSESTSADNNGRINISVDSNDYIYALWSNLNTAINLRRYTGSWQSTEVIATGTKAGDCCMYICQNDYIHVVYTSTDFTWYCYYRVYTTSWQDEEVAYTDTYNGYKPVCVVDSKGYVHVQMKRGNAASSDEIWYVRRTDDWETPIGIDTEHLVTKYSYDIMVTQSGAIIVWFIRNNQLYRRIRYGNGVFSSFIACTYEDVTSPSMFKCACSAYPTMNIPVGGHMGLVWGVYSGKDSTVFYYTTDYRPTDKVSDYTISPSLGSSVDSDIELSHEGPTNYVLSTGRCVARDSTGKIWYVYRDSTGIYAKTSTNNGLSWSDPSTVYSGTAYNATIAIDSNDYVHCVYDRVDGSYLEIKYKKYTTSWGSEEDVTSSSSNHNKMPGIAVDSNDYPHVMWLYGQNYSTIGSDILYRSRGESSWNTPEIANDSYEWSDFEFAIDSNNYIHVCGMNSYCWYLKRESTWSGATKICGAGGEANIPDRFGFYGAHITMFLDSNEYPHFIADYSSTTEHIDHCYYTGSGWSYDTFDPGGSNNDVWGITATIDKSDNITLFWENYDSSTSIHCIKYCVRTSSWGTKYEITHPISSSLEDKTPFAIWAFHPNCTSGVVNPNRPISGAFVIFQGNTNSTSYIDIYSATSSDLEWKEICGQNYTIQKSLGYKIIYCPNPIQEQLKYCIWYAGPPIEKTLQYAVEVSTTYTLQKALAYAVATSTTLQKGLTYTVPSSQTLQKDNNYAVATTTTLDKGLVYAVAVPKSIQKDLVYTVPTSSSIEKGLVYTVPEEKTLQKGLVYTVTATTTIQKGLEYAVVFEETHTIQKGLVYAVASPVTIQKWLVYTVPEEHTLQKGLIYTVSTETTLDKELVYLVAKSTTLQKGLIYAVITAATIQKGMDYVVGTTTTIQKELAYTVVTTDTLQKALAYNIGQVTTIQKGLVYAAAPSTTIQKGLQYVVTGAGLIQKDLIYAVPYAHEIQKGLIYTVPTTATLQKGLSYNIAVPTTIQKGLAYAVAATTTIQKDLAYTVPEEYELQKGLAYNILNNYSIQKTLEYDIQITETHTIQKGLGYVVPATNTIQKQLVYAVATGIEINKDLLYVVPNGVTLQKELSYNVSTVELLQKNLSYYVGALVTIQKELHYVVIAPHTIQKELVYAVLIEGEVTIQKGLQYTVSSTQTIQKDLIYAVLQFTTLQKNLEYAVAASITLQKQLEYTVPSSQTIDKELAYEVATPITIQKELVYTVPYSYELYKGLEYVVLVAGVIYKPLVYAVVTETTTQKPLNYNVAISTEIDKELKYAVICDYTIQKELAYTTLFTVLIQKTLDYDVGVRTTIQKTLEYVIFVPVTDPTRFYEDTEYLTPALDSYYYQFEMDSDYYDFLLD